jgi:hypothetical protein
MQHENFNPREYDPLKDLRGNGRVTLMAHRQTGGLVVRKAISGRSMGLYQQLLYARHKNLVEILGIEETESVCYSYEEYINGKTLADVLTEGVVPEKTALEWVGQLCSAARVLHEQAPAIVHRDIKPENVILTTDGVIKLIDFDAAKEYSPNKQKDTELIGTPEYAAPEQYGFAPSDPRTDIYAIGVLFHELLTRSRPQGITPYKGRYKHIIQTCIQLDPGRRYRSVRELERQIGIRGIGRVTGKIPGFRTGAWWKKLIASVTYFAAAVMAFSVVYEDPDFILFGCLISLCVPPYLLITNPFRFREKMPMIKSKSILIKVMGVLLYILGWLLLFAVMAVIYSESLPD